MLRKSESKTTSERIKPQAVHHRRVRKNPPMKPRENSTPAQAPHRHRQVRWIHRWMVQEPNWGFSTPQNYPAGKNSVCTPMHGRSITVYQACRSSQISARRCVFSYLTVPGTRHKRVFSSQELRYYVYLSGDNQSPVHGSLCSDSRQTSGNTSVPGEESIQDIVAQPGYENILPRYVINASAQDYVFPPTSHLQEFHIAYLYRRALVCRINPAPKRLCFHSFCCYNSSTTTRHTHSP